MVSPSHGCIFVQKLRDAEGTFLEIMGEWRREKLILNFSPLFILQAVPSFFLITLRGI